MVPHWYDSFMKTGLEKGGRGGIGGGGGGRESTEWRMAIGTLAIPYTTICIISRSFNRSIIISSKPILHSNLSPKSLVESITIIDHHLTL